MPGPTDQLYLDLITRLQEVRTALDQAVLLAPVMRGNLALADEEALLDQIDAIQGQINDLRRRIKTRSDRGYTATHGAGSALRGRAG